MAHMWSGWGWLSPSILWLLGLKVVKHGNKHFHLLSHRDGPTLLFETGLFTGTGPSGEFVHKPLFSM